jgi:isopentenyl-diphosphate delta-isomerase
VTSEADEVVLVDDVGRPVGRHDRTAVHGLRTPRHLAFSCWIVDPDGWVLMTRRALGKRSWPGVWTNSCCGHPRPEEGPEVALRRRVGEELGIGLAEVACVLPDFSYTAVDSSGIVENELCPVFRARLPRRPALTPDPDEVMEAVWQEPAAVDAAMRAAPYAFSPWAVEQLLTMGVAALSPITGPEAR